MSRWLFRRAAVATHWRIPHDPRPGLHRSARWDVADRVDGQLPRSAAGRAVKPFARLLLLLACTLCARVASAQGSTYSFEPPAPRTFDFVRLRIDTPGICAGFASGFVVDHVAREIVVAYEFTDYCDPGDPLHTVGVRFVDLGMLEGGTYAVSVYSCSNPPPPLPACRLRAVRSLTVVAARATHVVPSLHGWALLLLAAAISIAASMFTPAATATPATPASPATCRSPPARPPAPVPGGARWRARRR